MVSNFFLNISLLRTARRFSMRSFSSLCANSLFSTFHVELVLQVPAAHPQLLYGSFCAFHIHQQHLVFLSQIVQGGAMSSERISCRANRCQYLCSRLRRSSECMSAFLHIMDTARFSPFPSIFHHQCCKVLNIAPQRQRLSQ